MSFALTQPQLLDRSKTVTRRLGWQKLKAGEELLAVNKCMGLKKGEQAIVLGRIRVKSVRREPLGITSDEEAKREGFPHMTGQEFVEMFCHHMKCKPYFEVTRIEFELVRTSGWAERP